ncbi:hypothetical protein ACORG1_34100 (plasmid) [Mycobacterium sp. TJFP1]|uniref:hypothetical protein n=1 Tax=Mycobacterium sp. MS1601 TaxID=1936029 RepID=UPI0012F790D9|nr:hypothetical protein [Mycobacterium sp. MS1601]
MSRRKRAPNTPRIGTVFELVGDDAVDEFKAVCAAYGLAPKELVHKLVTENIAGLREDPFRGSLVERGIEYLREARRRRELASIHRSWEQPPAVIEGAEHDNEGPTGATGRRGPSSTEHRRDP